MGWYGSDTTWLGTIKTRARGRMWIRIAGDRALRFRIPGRKTTQVRKPRRGPQHRWRPQLYFWSRARW